MLLLLLLSHFSRVRLCVTPWTAAHQAPPVPGILQARTLEWVAISFSIIVQLLLLLSRFSRVRLCVTPWTAACQASLSFPISQSLLKLVSIESVIPCNHLIL